jgi:hypothetical protein
VSEPHDLHWEWNKLKGNDFYAFAMVVRLNLDGHVPLYERREFGARPGRTDEEIVEEMKRYILERVAVIRAFAERHGIEAKP